MRHFFTILLVSLCGCVATPLPHPPTMDPELITMTHDGSAVHIVGAEGAAEPPGQELRVTWVPGPSSAGFPTSMAAAVGADSTIDVTMLGALTDEYYFEAITEDEDIFLVAITGGTGDQVQVLDPEDEDGDGSPDDIDCAPLDRTVGGQRCQ